MDSEATVTFTDVAVLADTGEAFVCRLEGKTVRIPPYRIHPASDLRATRGARGTIPKLVLSRRFVERQGVACAAAKGPR